MAERLADFPPWQTVRYDWLACPLLEMLDEIQDCVPQWLGTYNPDPPKMALGGITAGHTY